MKIDEKLIGYLAELSRLALTEAEGQARMRDLSDILDYMDRLNELDTDGLPEMTHPFEASNRFRDDEVTGSDRRADMLANAPEARGDYFKVFKTVEE
ncbi:MAG: Asp-tRNA(Asn)/Glu-tRNA(Gln) amidotransferase subunit GatC [Clostridiales Family XIII bacterium]|jgi:aspartyl-tRNA(Asn)/glutamyl-tRNA(Gln) amidotransferase subunit C|nr:Asp-tRNA(Asn)/Glu-tRNA(Gln) amidotransferase subunit GatC [Clostridiales Family XIII bacterium]